MKLEEKQNQDSFLELLYAQRFYYDKARLFRRFRTIISILLPLVSILSILTFTSLKMSLAIAGALWLIISRLILQEKEKYYTKLAATIQEEFDTNLFNIEWNKVMVGDRAKPELIHYAVSRFTKRREKLKDWYVGLKCQSLYLNTLLAQRTNLVWDQNLRKSYALFVRVITWTALGTLFVLAIYWKMTVEEFLVTLVLPSLSAFVYGLENSRSHQQRALQSERIEKDISASFERDRNHAEYSNPQLIREYQNQIFLRRSEPTVIAKWWYWIRQKKNNETMKRVNEILSNSCQ